MRRLGKFLLLGLLLLGPAQAQTLEGPALVEALRQGGFVIFFRHAATDRSQTDRDTLNLKNCQTQRNLNEAGRAQSRAVGEAFRALRIPVGAVLSSPYCRARETARLAFGRAELDVRVTSPLADGSDRAALSVELARLLSAAPPAGQNTVIVAHMLNLSGLTGVVLEEGEAAVYRPLGQGRYERVARVTAEGWGRLAQGR